jgi:ADP-ribosylglycohydrolase
MLGAIIGDIVGSVYEWDNIKTKDFPLFTEHNFFTDDTIITIAIAEALMNGGNSDDFIIAMKKYGRLYPDADYGGRFGSWLFSDDREPYSSWGNRSAMRVSPCSWIVPLCKFINGGVDNVERLAEKSAEVTHNHPEGIKGAKAVARAIYLMRHGKARNQIAEYKKFVKRDIEDKYDYDLSRTLDEIRPTYRFNESCQETVPEAMIAFLESTDFEDAIRNAISLGGDSDTLTAITGSIAEAAYGVPEQIASRALSYLDTSLQAVYDRWQTYIAE